jgi:hypothetical protein
MSITPQLPTTHTHQLDPNLLDYEQLSALVANMIAPEVADVVADRVTNVVREANGWGVGPQRRLKEKKRRERCRPVQVSERVL